MKTFDTARCDTYWTHRLDAAVPAAGTLATLTGTAPVNEQWNLAAVEIPPSGTGSPVTTNYGYDTRGNRTTVTPSGGSATTLAYDQANRLTTYGTTATYAYNGDGLRTAKTVNGVTQSFVWDVSGGLPQLLMDGTTAYVYAPDGTPLEQISKPSAPAVDQVVSADQTSKASTVTSPAFSTSSPGELVLAFVSAGGDAGQTISSVSGGSLTWSLASRANGQKGTSEVWQAWATGKLSVATVTATLTQGGNVSSITVATFTGAATTIGAPQHASAANGAPTVNLTTTQANSLVWGTGNDWDLALARSPASGQSLVHQDLDAFGDTFWTQKINNPVATAGTTVALADTAPTGDRWNLAAVEIKPPSNTVLWYHHDQLGSTRTLTDTNGAVVGAFTYDAYGRPAASSGTATTPFGYAGQYTDVETGYQYLRARYYDTSSSQFLTRDALESMTGRAYGYANGSPLAESDPSGLSSHRTQHNVNVHTTIQTLRGMSCEDLFNKLVLAKMELDSRDGAFRYNHEGWDHNNKFYHDRLDYYELVQIYMANVLTVMDEKGCNLLDERTEQDVWSVVNQLPEPLGHPGRKPSGRSNSESILDVIRHIVSGGLRVRESPPIDGPLVPIA